MTENAPGSDVSDSRLGSVTSIVSAPPICGTATVWLPCRSGRKQYTATIDDYCRNIIAYNMLRYPALLHNTPPHSHSILSMHRNALIYKRNFFQPRQRTDSPIRQKFALLISNGNFGDLRFPWFQRLSASIGRFAGDLRQSARIAFIQKDRQPWQQRSTG
jgi:hypothetical protein